jgi:hypothetical protein
LKLESRGPKDLGFFRPKSSILQKRTPGVGFFIIEPMKTILIALSFVCALNTFAGDSKAKKKTTQTQKAEMQRKDTKTNSPLTGSYLRQEYQRTGQITDGSQQVIVLDSDYIRRSGASDLRALLRRSHGH